MTKAEIEKNIQAWEYEVQQALNENDLMRATMCRVLANKLRDDLKNIDD